MKVNARINELWSLRINPSDLFNIERPKEVNPETGGGHTYIQIPRGKVDDTLKFLRAEYPTNGNPLILEVGDQSKPNIPPEIVYFYNKSSGRMRISKQNRHRHGRLQAWTPASGFPILEANDTTEDAKEKLAILGGLHIYLARSDENEVWAGFTTGQPTTSEKGLPFSDILWGQSAGGYWSYK